MSHRQLIDENTARCTTCEIDIELPRETERWPAPARRLHGLVWIDASPMKRRPDGSQGLQLPPWSDVLVDFWIAHAHGVPLQARPSLPPPRQPAVRCVLGPVTIVPDELYRVVVVDGGTRHRWHYECRDDAEAAAQAARDAATALSGAPS